MNKSIRKVATTASAALVSLSLIAAAGTSPALAGGSFSITVNATNPDDRNALQTALGIYSIVNGIRGGSGIRQAGSGNSAGLRQNGRNNRGVVYQEGKGHRGTLDQVGNHNTHGLFQFGKNTNARVHQYGHGQTGATFVFGW